VDYNARVKKDQVIAKLDAGTYEAAVHEAEGDLANAEAGLELARLNADRSTTMLKESLIPTADNDKAQADLHQAQAQVKIKAATLERAKVDLEHCTIYAPVDGVVISRNVDVGQTVAASLSAPTIYVIANDLSKMQIDANVSEADVGGVEEGQTTMFTVDAFPYRTFRGKVVQIRNSPITNQNVVSYDTVIAVDNEDLKLKPGMTANVSIIVAEKDNVLKVPNGALRFRPPETNDKPATVAGMMPGGTRPASGPSAPSGGIGIAAQQPLSRTIYTLSTLGGTNDASGELKPAQIKTGISDGMVTEVIEGLGEGQIVVLGITVSATTGTPASNPFNGPRRF
jgi:HlyD family secretion protein